MILTLPYVFKISKVEILALGHQIGLISHVNSNPLQWLLGILRKIA